MILGSIYSKKYIKVFKMKIVKNLPSISAKDIKTPPLGVSCYDESNEL
jgi:hypothetical protein